MRDFFAEELEALRKRALDRHLREISNAQGPEVVIAGRHFINCSSNDYLGLANDPRLREAAASAIDEFGVGRRRLAANQRDSIAAFAPGTRASDVERNRSCALFQQRIFRGARNHSRPGHEK